MSEVSIIGCSAKDEVAVAGHSCGGLQAIELAADPRIKTVIVNNSGIFKGGKSPIAGISADRCCQSNRNLSPIGAAVS